MREPVSKIRIIIYLLLLLEVCLGAALIVATIFYEHILGTFMTEVESEMLSAKFFNTYVLGVQLIASYLCSMSMWASIWSSRYSQNVQLLLRLWLFFCFLIVVCGCATVWSLLTSAGALVESAEMVLYKGIDMYYMNPEWKFLWDQLQYTKECCGVNSYQDWIHASWLPQNINAYIGPPMSIRNRQHVFSSNHVYEMYSTTDCPEAATIPESIKNDVHKENLSNQVETYALTGPHNHENDNNAGEHTLAPYACCKHDSVSCYENYVPTSDGLSGDRTHLNLSEINTKGCLSLFSGYMWRVINILCILMLAAILADIIICCLTKYLMMSNNNARVCNSEFNSDMAIFDDAGNSLVVIKCSPNVKCFTLKEQNTYNSETPNVLSDTGPCLCGIEDNIGGINEGPNFFKAKGKNCQRPNNNIILH